MIVLDASVLVAHLNPADAHHQSAAGILLAGTPGRMLVHTITLAEILVAGVRIGQGASLAHTPRLLRPGRRDPPPGKPVHLR